MMRIKYLTENEDYVIKKKFQSELNNEVYKPENYFINNLGCNKLLQSHFTLDTLSFGQFLNYNATILNQRSQNAAVIIFLIRSGFSTSSDSLS
jgi:hypothetical protein